MHGHMPVLVRRLCVHLYRRLFRCQWGVWFLHRVHKLFRLLRMLWWLLHNLFRGMQQLHGLCRHLWRHLFRRVQRLYWNVYWRLLLLHANLCSELQRQLRSRLWEWLRGRVRWLCFYLLWLHGLF